MKYKYLIVPFLILYLSCTATRINRSTISKNRIETIEYKNYKGEKVDHYGVSKEEYYYDKNGLVNIKYLDSNNELIKSKENIKNSEWKFYYDENGNFTKQVAYNEKGEIMDMEGFWNSAIEKYDYNEKNQLVEEGNYDKEENLLNMGDIQIAFTKFGYNKKGQLAWSKSYDSKKKEIKNGYCYSKYEYNKAGLLEKHSYLYDEDKINLYSKFHYKDRKLIREETFDKDNNEDSYIEYVYEDERIISIKTLYRRGEEPIYEEEIISLDLKGWTFKDSDIKKMVFKESGKGEYKMKINTKGEIINLEPIRVRGHKFELELYEKLKNIKLKKDSNGQNQVLEGKLIINILSQETGILDELLRTLKPIPYNFH